MMFRWLAAATLSVLPLAALAAPVQVSSPDGHLQVSLDTDPDGRPSYAVTRNGKPLIEPSRLGFMLVDAPKLERNFVIGNPRTRSFDETWEQPWGERHFIRNHYNELKVTLTENRDDRRSFDVVVRVYDDGLGFRYEFPQQPKQQQIRIGDELTEFTLAQDGTAWWIPAQEWNRAEYLYHQTPISEVGDAQTPITFKLADGTHLSIHEAALVDYSGMNLTHAEGRRLRALLTPGSGDAKVVREAPFHTPWRTIQVADNAGGLVESSLILNLNEPNQLGDVSWVKPMKYVGVWWEMHLDQKSWSSGPRHGATNENVRRHIDFAAANGFGGVLVEGWNVGWDGDWFYNGEVFSFTQPYPDFDLPALSAYAIGKGVRLIGHHETSGNTVNYEKQLDAALDLYQKVGVTSVKTGYVADAGQAIVYGRDGKPHHGWHEGQDMSRHHQKVVLEAAKRHISVNPHEPIKDTGLRRTWPNWVAREGARGMEYSAWGQPGNPPEHEANLVFTRLLAGPMDYTPGIFGMKTRSPTGVASTWAKQLALYVVIYSPIQMAADLLDNYEKPEVQPAFQFIKDVPVDWEDTRVLNGEVGDYVTIARKDRHSQDWYVGAVSDDQARDISVPLAFLPAGKRYTAQIYRDGADADWQKRPESIVIESREVGSKDVLSIRLAAGGGAAIRLIAR